MKAREVLSKLSLLALQKRRQGLVKLLPPVAETLRGSLIERYLTCGNPNCKCARGRRNGPVWYLSVALGPGRTTGTIVPVHLLERVRRNPRAESLPSRGNWSPAPASTNGCGTPPWTSPPFPPRLCADS